MKFQIEKYMIICFIPLAAIRCGSSEKKIETAAVEKDTVSPKDTISKEKSMTAPVKSTPINKNSVVYFITFEKETDTTDWGVEMNRKLQNWKLDTNIAKTLLKNVPPAELGAGHNYASWGYSYKGKCVIDGQVAKFGIEAGSMTWIKYTDVIIDYADEKGMFKKYFISGRRSMRGEE